MVLKPLLEKKAGALRTRQAGQTRGPQARASGPVAQWQADVACLLRRHERDRSRMARTVHDELAQALTAMNLELSIWRTELEVSQEVSATGVRAKISALTEQLGGAINCARSISSGLQSRVLENFGLGAAIESLAKKWAQRTGRSAEFSTDRRTEKLALDPFLSGQVFYLAQDLIELRAAAEIKHLHVRLSVQGRALLLVLEDDGPERSLTAEIQARVRLLGGVLPLRKKHSIQIKVPLRPAE